ncbi:MAG: HD domain-containing protein [Solirubrobacterales bacterium]
MPATDDPLDLIRAALAGRPAWLVGGAVRDRLLGTPPTGGPGGGPPDDARSRPESRGDAPGGATLLTGAADLDVVIDGEPREAARAIARAARGAAAFALSEEYGGWRVVARDGAWQVDVERLRGDTLEGDLALRDFTVNALAEPLGDPGAGRAETIDPLGGLRDLAARRLRAAGPRAFAEDPLRVLRLVRIAVELGFEPDAPTRAQARAGAEGLRAVAGERVFMELRRILDAPRAVPGLELMADVGATPVVLPELDATRGVQQSRYHHLDVYGHTLEVLAQAIALQEDPAAILGSEHRDALAALLAEPLADGLTRGRALRWGALLHDIAKPLTREVLADPRSVADGRVTFLGHDALGAQLTGELLGRLRASGRLRSHVAALVRHHLRLGFLVHEPQPLARRTVFAYLRACEPVEVDVTLLSVADRLATRGERAQESIDAHLRLAQGMLGDALRWRAGGGPPPGLWRGDELARELGIPLGPRVGELLEELAEARYAGEIATRAQALEHARKHLSAAGAGPRGGDRGGRRGDAEGEDGGGEA